MTFEELPAGWEVWNEEAGGLVIFAYRPDVFDSDSYPAACLPTITVARGRSPDQPPERRRRSDTWHVAFYLEPVVRVRSCDAMFESRDVAIDGAVALATRFANGEIDYRDAYQVPRDDYLTALDGLVGA